MLRVIGIDFGTSTTYMNVKRYDGNKPLDGDKFSVSPVTFKYGASSGNVETLVQKLSDGKYQCGSEVDEDEQDSIIREIKMSLESEDEEKKNEAKKATQAFFEYLFNNYNQQKADYGDSGDEVETIISYPVKWKEETRRFMIEAAKNAGFENVRAIDEAHAAVYSVLVRQIDDINKSVIGDNKQGYMMLVDMGAGTTDIVICKYQFNPNTPSTDDSVKLNIVTCWPNNADAPTFGGREVDAKLAKYVEDYLTDSLPEEMKSSAKNIAYVNGETDKWKRTTVSKKLANNDAVTTCAYAYNKIAHISSFTKGFPELTRTNFEELIQDGLADFAKLINDSINDAAQKDADFAEQGLDLVILTGGHSAWYFSSEIIDGTMQGYVDNPLLSKIRENKNRVIKLTNPQSTVANGLVYSKLPFDVKSSNKDAKNDERDILYMS